MIDKYDPNYRKYSDGHVVTFKGSRYIAKIAKEYDCNMIPPYKGRLAKDMASFTASESE